MTVYRSQTGVQIDEEDPKLKLIQTIIAMEGEQTVTAKPLQLKIQKMFPVGSQSNRKVILPDWQTPTVSCNSSQEYS